MFRRMTRPTYPNERDSEDRRAFLNRGTFETGRGPLPNAPPKTRRFATFVPHCQLPPAQTLASAWEELRVGLSAESRFVKQVDILETFLQSTFYQEQDPSLPMDSFRQEVLERLEDPLLAGIRDAALEVDGEGH